MRTGFQSRSHDQIAALEAISKDRNASQKHVWRADIVLLSAEGVGTNEIMRRTGTSKTCVWRWQQRLMEEGVNGPLRRQDAALADSRARPGGGRALVALTLADPPTETTHWTADLMARANGISASAVRRIWKARHSRQLCRPQASQRSRLARSPSAFRPPLHADLVLLAQRRRGILREAQPTSIEAQYLPLRRRSSGRLNRFVAETNANPKPFTWTANPDKIIAAVKRGHQVLDSIH